MQDRSETSGANTIDEGKVRSNLLLVSFGIRNESLFRAPELEEVALFAVLHLSTGAAVPKDPYGFVWLKFKTM